MFEDPIRRGLKLRCARCGEGKLSRGKAVALNGETAARFQVVE